MINGSIENSGVYGNINLPTNYEMVGGLVGAYNGPLGQSYGRIYSSFANVTISAQNNVAGFIGSVSEDLSITNSYNYSTSLECSAVNCSAAGFIHSIIGGAINLMNVYSATVGTLTNDSGPKSAIFSNAGTVNSFMGHYYVNDSAAASVDSGIIDWELRTDINLLNEAVGNDFGSFGLIYKPAVQYGYGQPLEIEVYKVPGK
jgi:hypothetical protein